MVAMHQRSLTSPYVIGTRVEVQSAHLNLRNKLEDLGAERMTSPRFL